MPVKSLSNLFLATGLSAVSGGMGFRANMPGAPLPDGRRFGNYIFASVTDVSRNFNDSTIIPNYTTLSWTLTRNSVAEPNRLTDLTPPSFTVTLSDIKDDAGVSRPGTVSLIGPSVTYSGNTITFTARLDNSRTVTAWGSDGGGDAWHSCRFNVTASTDTAFNDPQMFQVTDIKVRTRLDGQGDPGTAPSAGSIDTTYPGPGGVNFVQFSVNNGWLVGLVGSGNTIEYQWALNDSSFTTVDSTLSAPVFATAGGTAFTIYCRVRVVAPYVGPWSSPVSTIWNDPRTPE